VLEHDGLHVIEHVGAGDSPQKNRGSDPCSAETSLRLG
jgi:hypothetical protein